MARYTAILYGLTLSLVSANALASEASVVHAEPRDPHLRLVVDFDGAVPDDSELTVELEHSYAEVLNTQTLANSGLPTATMVLVDTSLSMRNDFDDVRIALMDFVDGMEGGDVVVLVPFHQEVRGTEDPWLGVADAAALREQITNLRADGLKTRLYEALNRSIDRLIADTDRYPLRTILVLSDGADDDSPTGQGLERARTRAIDKDIQINSVGYVPKNDDNTDILRDLATDTRGTYQLAETPAAITEHFQRQQDAVHHLAVITLVAESLTEGKHELRLTMERGEDSETVTHDVSISEPFEGEELEGNDPPEPPDYTVHYIVGALSGTLFLGGVLGLTIRGRRRRAQKITDELNRKVAEANAEAQRAIDAATAVRPKSIGLMLPDTRIELFAPDAFGMITVGADHESSTVVLTAETVSGCHCQIERRPDDPFNIYVTDLDSSNGTYHQGLDIRGRGTIRVAHHDRLQFGLLATLVDMKEA